MYKEKKVIVIMPAYYAEHTLRKTYDEVIGQDWVDQVIVVDANSQDDTVPIAKTLPKADVYAHAKNSDDLVFDNQMLAQIIWYGFTIAEVSCPTKYFEEASSINLFRSIKYGFGCLVTSVKFKLAKMDVMPFKQFPNE